MIIDAASRLPRITVEQIMIHREDIVYLSLGEEDETNLLRARQTMHSRLPLCHRDLGDLVGFVNVKQVLWRLVTDPEDREEEGLKRILGEAVRPPLKVSPTLEVSQLLQLFSKHHEHLAVVEVKDEVVGIVTLEDVIEEIVGEVDDEYDRSPHHIDRPEPNLFRFGGGTAWVEVARALRISPGEIGLEDVDLDGRYDLNDLVADRLRGKLRTGGVFAIGRWRFKVTRMRRGKVVTVEARLLGARTSGEGSVSSSA